MCCTSVSPRLPGGLVLEKLLIDIGGALIKTHLFAVRMCFGGVNRGGWLILRVEN